MCRFPQLLIGVADHRVQRGERLGDLAIMAKKSRLGIDVRGSAHLIGDFLGGEILAVKLAGFVFKEIHGQFSLPPSHEGREEL